MKAAYFDCQFGAAGDMLNAALLAAGADEAVWRAELAKIKLDGQSIVLKVSDVMRCGLAAKKMDVLDEHGVKWDEHEKAHQAHEKLHDHSHEHQHSHDHDDEHGHEHHHGHSHSYVDEQHEHTHEHTHEHEHGRRLPEILRIIDDAGLRPGARLLATRIFRRLAEAESRVHGKRPEEVHFHEVGAVDSIVDIVGFAVAYDLLGIEKSFGSSLAIGSGVVKSQHGLFPVPGPATLYLLEAAQAPIAESKIGFECLTPTGAAILCEVVSEWGKQPPVEQIAGIGYGAGTKDPADWPNTCRVVIGELADTVSGAKTSSRFVTESLAVVETNLDDFNPQALAFVSDKLFQSGALDVTITPVLMKKGRAGHILTALCKPADRVLIQEIILEETSSIGVRWYMTERLVAKREWHNVDLGGGSIVRVKVARDNRGHVINAQPEFDDCAKYAEEHHVPVKDVLLDAMAGFRNKGDFAR